MDGKPETYVTNAIETIHVRPLNSFIFFAPNTDEEMLKITDVGFWVRGIKIEQGEDEAKEVYKAFKQMLNL